VIRRLRVDEHVLVLGSGPTSIRFRPALTVTSDELDRALAAIGRVLASVVG
jgi:L-lysine 6-transaminase